MGVIPSLVMLFVIAGVLIYFGMIYNGLVAMRNDIDKSWANIDVLLKQRHDEVPRLVDVCKGYMQYERETLQTLIEARARYATAATLDQKVRRSASSWTSSQGTPSTSVRKRSIRRWRRTMLSACSAPLSVNAIARSEPRVM